MEILLIYLSNAEEHIGRVDRLKLLEDNLAVLPLVDNSLFISTAGEGMPIPEGIAADPYLASEAMKWNYVVQTAQDRRQEADGAYRVMLPYNHEKVVYGYGERYYAQNHGMDNRGPMHVRQPKKGLFLLGI